MSKTHEHMEHVEHAGHAAHDPFDRKVSMTMAIVAAALAAMTMFSHREHTETIRQQGEANGFQVEASDAWALYQAKNIREHEYEAFLLLLGVLAKDPTKEEEAKKAQKAWVDHIKKYKEVDLPAHRKDAEEKAQQAVKHMKLSHLSHARTNRFDSGELGLELAMVFCSLAVLTKRPGWWYASIGVGVVGLLVGLSAFLMEGALASGH